jgi:hypothetical protein
MDKIDNIPSKNFTVFGIKIKKSRNGRVLFHFVSG